jgi:hypothetical protein
MRASHIALIAAMLAIPSVGYADNEQADFKEKFKAGCESANGSFIEDADRDGQYQCNAPSGDVNRCFSDTPPHACVHINAEDCKFGC